MQQIARCQERKNLEEEKIGRHLCFPGQKERGKMRVRGGEEKKRAKRD